MDGCQGYHDGKAQCLVRELMKREAFGGFTQRGISSWPIDKREHWVLLLLASFKPWVAS
jgi:hypothetical protein